MDAQGIYQDHLDRVSRAVWDRDFRTIANLHHYPHVVRHPDDVRQHKKEEDLIELIKKFRTHMEGLGATCYHRVCERASFDPLDRDRIAGAHWTYILRGGNYLCEPYSCELVISRKNGKWLAADIVTPPLRHGVPIEPSISRYARGRMQ